MLNSKKHCFSLHIVVEIKNFIRLNLSHKFNMTFRFFQIKAKCKTIIINFSKKLAHFNVFKKIYDIDNN